MAAMPEPGCKHVHHAYIWLAGIRNTLIVLFILAISLINDETIELAMMVGSGAYSAIVAMILGGIALLLLIVLGLVFGIRALSYRNLWYVAGPSEFSLYSGVISKKQVHIPYDKIQSVDTRASLIDRVFGLCNVLIDTAGGAANKAVRIPYLSKSDADNLRATLYERKQQTIASANSTPSNATPNAPLQADTSSQASMPNATGNVLDFGKEAWDEVGGVFAGQKVATESPSFEYGLTNGELFLTGAANGFAAAVFLTVMIIALFATAGIVISLAVWDEGDMNVLEALGSYTGAGLVIVGIVALAIIGLILFVWVVSVASSCLSYGGFKARRVADRIEVEQGLLQHKRQTIAVARIQTVIVTQSLFKRMIGRCELSIGKVSAVQDSSQGNSKEVADKTVLHPFLKISDVQAILNSMLPELSDAPASLVSPPKVALRRSIIRNAILKGSGFWLAICTIGLQLICQFAFSAMGIGSAGMQTVSWAFAILYAICLLLFCLGVVRGVLWYKGSGFATNDRSLVIVNSGISVSRLLIQKRKIQFGYTRQNPLQRLAGTSTLCAETAQGVGGSAVSLIDVGSQEGSAWLDWLKPKQAEALAPDQP